MACAGAHPVDRMWPCQARASRRQRPRTDRGSAMPAAQLGGELDGPHGEWVSGEVARCRARGSPPTAPEHACRPTRVELRRRLPRRLATGPRPRRAVLHGAGGGEATNGRRGLGDDHGARFVEGCRALPSWTAAIEWRSASCCCRPGSGVLRARCWSVSRGRTSRPSGSRAPRRRSNGCRATHADRLPVLEDRRPRGRHPGPAHSGRRASVNWPSTRAARRSTSPRPPGVEGRAPAEQASCRRRRGDRSRRWSTPTCRADRPAPRPRRVAAGGDPPDRRRPG